MPRGRGRALRSYLAVLVVTPLLAGSVATGLLVADEKDVADDAHAATRAVSVALAVEQFRSAVSGEIAPAAGNAALDQPRVYLKFGLTDEQAAAVPRSTLQAMAARAHDRTNDALWALSTAGGTDVDGAELGARVSAARAAVARDVNAGYSSYATLLGDVDQLMQRELTRSQGLGLDPAAQESLDDLEQLSQVAAAFDAASRLYLEQLTVPDVRPSFVAAWGLYAARNDKLGTSLNDTSLMSLWARADTTLASRHVEDMLAAGALDGTRPALGDFTIAAIGGSERGWYSTQTTTAAARSVTVATARKAHDAQRRLVWTLVVALGIGAVTTVATVVVHRRIERPLRAVSGQSESLLAGVLVDVPESGPREVRAVARGLATAVEGLRRVRLQADAIAAGDLDHDVTLEPLEGPLGELVHSSVTQLVSAFAARRDLQEHLEHAATHDPLTGLANRARVLHLLAAALERDEDPVQGGPADGRVGVFFVDLDHFKAVNDTHGHAAGDQVLQAVAHRMQDALRAGDVVGRLGGDEFVVIVDEVSDSDLLEELARRLVATVSSPIALRRTPGSPLVQVGASIGVAVGSRAAVDAAGLLEHADAAVYRAKRAGRGVVRVWDGDRPEGWDEPAGVVVDSRSSSC
ncbi:GGDEF domain-containing protein [Kineococcus sp. NPDC059986]|jgi:diguanylate cyclase (GGDEF)-like protein|uniref:GGDEF domain-containing protein n=1 Tax=Kineococcus sp. NPDC059986 TaxID=3155538 RepID=UPI00344F7B8D